jgi:dienelactone hydrolase
MKLVVATDIFGQTPELQVWLTPIVQASGGELDVVSPYLQQCHADELVTSASTTDALAYQQFLAVGGSKAYTEKLQSHLDLQQAPFIAIGFSAGAAALWQLAAKPQPQLQQLIGFYGGQIRHGSELQPLVSTTLIWSQETHFDVTQLHQQLAQRPRVSSVLTHYQHGFINPYSAGFNSRAASNYQQWLIAKLDAATSKAPLGSE